MTMRSRLLAALVLPLALVFSAAHAARWGEHGHRMIGRLAAETLPPDVPAFLRDAAPRLAYLNVEPDRWRGTERNEMYHAHVAEHYINLERLPDGALRAPHRFAYLDSLRAAGIETPGPGLLPWRIIEMTQRVQVGFRLWRAATDPDERAWIEQRIIDDAGVLGHYVADASNPAHTTIHHNGWVGANPRGYTTDRTFHRRFETIFVRENVRIDDVRSALTASPRVLESVRDDVMTYLADSHALVPYLYELELAEPFGPRTRSATHKRFAVERLAAGAAMLRDLWLTAWRESAVAEDD
jgi:hypothetical protein